jgi:hypothetical protein
MRGLVKLAYESSRDEDYTAFHDPLNSSKDRMSALQDWVRKTKGLPPASKLKHGLVGAGVGGLVGLALSRGSAGGLVTGGIIGGGLGVLNAIEMNQQIRDANSLSGKGKSDLQKYLIRTSSAQRSSERQSDRSALHYAAYK